MFLRQQNIKVNIRGITKYPTENDLLRYSYHRLGYHPENNRGLQLEMIGILLQDFGVPSQWDSGHTMKDLAQWIEEEKSCLIGVCSKDWHRPDTDHAARHIFSVTAVVYNLSQRSQSKTIAGFIVADTSKEDWGKLFRDTEHLQKAWGGDGSRAIVSTWSYSSGGQVIEPGKGLWPLAVSRPVDAT
ncbi:hypothetical protein KSF_078730 [Reticulibacter mediterranei]|uniref:Uncharacterized protein n=2 Tax=Reticulibacter mediterranei TaxID=2778369 RepID=A0A8J3N6V1_9CHLR|nr:hypothetical protein KSF_078730 [Reticulibacter mediterranei]